MAELNWGAVTNEGMIRAQNEDSMLVREGLFVVADGMGGHQAGEVASALAVSRMAANLEGTPGRLDALIASIRDANADIFDAAATDATQQGMVQASTRTEGSMPSALVMMLRRGWLRASSAVMWPASMSSCT